MKKIKVVLVMILSVVLIGCSKNYDKITGEKFKQVMKDNLFEEIANVTNSYDDVSEAYYVNDELYVIEYIDYLKGADASGMYLDEVSNIYTSEDQEFEAIKGDNYNIAKIIKDDRYYIIMKIKTSCVYIEGEVKYKEVIDDIADELLK